jgi:hypothetical protein
MSAVSITAITDLMLAAEALFLAGRMTAFQKTRFSASWYWSGVLLLLGVAAFLGGIDHGFFETGRLDRYWIERPNWIVLAAMTWCVLMTAGTQFLSTRVQRILLVSGAVQFLTDAILALRIDSFLVVIVNYAPVMILMLILNFIGLRKRLGSPSMIAGILILFAASAVQALAVDVFSPLDRNGLYHVICMAGVVFLYAGGRHLKTA